MKGIVTSIWYTREGLLKMTISFPSETPKTITSRALDSLEKDFTNEFLNENVEVTKITKTGP